MSEAGFIDCGLTVVHPWLCDAMGHLTTRHYVAMFDDAAYHLFAAIGYDPSMGVSESWGWADVRHEIDYKSEVASGALLRIRGRIAALGNRSLTAEYRMEDSVDGRLCATLVARTVCFDLAARKAMPVPDKIRLLAAERFPPA